MTCSFRGLRVLAASAAACRLPEDRLDLAGQPVLRPPHVNLVAALPIRIERLDPNLLLRLKFPSRVLELYKDQPGATYKNPIWKSSGGAPRVVGVVRQPT